VGKLLASIAVHIPIPRRRRKGLYDIMLRWWNIRFCITSMHENGYSFVREMNMKVSQLLFLHYETF
jgi:hypothetical protein